MKKYISCGNPPSREFASSLRFLAKTIIASSFGGSGGNADDRGLYVILSASEISHDLSEKNMLYQFFGGILHSYYKAHNADAF